MSAHAILLGSCTDRPGIIAATAGMVHTHGGNIVDLQQHTDRELGVFFQRVEFEIDDFDLGRADMDGAFHPLRTGFDMDCSVHFDDEVPATALLVSKEQHCALDLLGRWRAGELAINPVAVISNHADLAEAVAWHGVAYHHLPVSPDTQLEQEAQLSAVLAALGVELVVLARYMRILSPGLVTAWPARIINIHHSFLPAFQGGRPYHQAHARGVKVIGVTAHYVTAELDEGPIIDQDVVRVSHRDEAADLRRKGRDLEVVVLARAVRAHLEHRVLVHGNRTIVFEG